MMVGAGTLRADNPSFITHDPTLISKRRASGLPDDPVKITVTNRGDLERDLLFFKMGEGKKIIYCTDLSYLKLTQKFSDMASVVSLGERITAAKIVDHTKRLGIRSIFLEGGEQIHTMFFSENMVHELRFAVAPFFVGDPIAPRFVGAGRFPFDKSQRMTLLGVEKFTDTIAIRYGLRPYDE